MMEAFAVLAFHRAAQDLGDAAPGEDEKINPYAVSLDPDRWEADGLLDGDGHVAGRGARDATPRASRTCSWRRSRSRSREVTAWRSAHALREPTPNVARRAARVADQRAREPAGSWSRWVTPDSRSA